MSYSYTYNLPDDFPVAGICAADALTAEISASSIPIVCDEISCGADTVTVVFRQELTLPQKTVLDGLVTVHTGVPLPSATLTDANGYPIVSPSFLFTNDDARLEGFELVGNPGETAILDVEITSQILVQGGQFWISGASAGDRAQFSVVDKNNILGLHTQYGLPVGTPIELARFVKNYPLPPVPMFQDSIVMPTVASVAAGLFLRAQLDTAQGGQQRRIGILYRWYVR